MIDKLDLNTERLRIRHFRQSDLDACVEFHRTVFGSEKPVSAIERWLQWTIDSYRELAGLGQPPYADYAIELKASGRVIGSVGIVPTLVPWGALEGDADDNLISPEIGLFWGILPAWRRRGYATEAGQALLAFLFHQMRVRQVVATTESDNIASQRTMSRLGMTLLRNPLEQPAWRQVVGLIRHPASE